MSNFLITILTVLTMVPISSFALEKGSLVQCILKDSESSTQYVKDVDAIIKENWRPANQPKSYKVVVLFYINKNGNISEIKIRKSSRIKQADKDALSSVKKAAPFPLHGCEKDVPILITFEYTLNTLQPSNKQIKSRVVF